MYLNNNFNQLTPNQKYKASFKANGEVRTRDLCANDMHGILGGYRKLMTVVDRFESEKKQNPDIISSVYLSGDGAVGANRSKNKLIVVLENMLKPRAKAPGNHDFDDNGAVGLSELMDKSKVKTLALNLVTKPNSVLQDDIDAGRLAKSQIFEENGTKFGVIGLIPSDLFQRLNQQSKDKCKDMSVLNLQDTIKAVQDEVNKLEAQGVKIIKVLSHMGYDADVEIIKNVEGVDVVHGAHSHHVLPDLVPGKNYFISKRGEPVILTQAGKNGHWYSLLDVVYDKDGKIIKAKQEVKSLDNEKDSLKAVMAEQMMIGAPKKIATMTHDVPSVPEQTFAESAMNSFICDAYKKYTGADIVFNNTGTVRNTIKTGDVTDRMIVDMMPYYNSISTYKLSEKDIIDAINGGLQAGITKKRTGALQVAGMSYVIGKDAKVKEAYKINDDGTKEPMNVKNPSPDKFFTVTYNSFLSGGTEGLDVLNAPEKKIKDFEQNETDLVIDYFKSFENKPLDIKTQGRITLENGQG